MINPFAMTATTRARLGLGLTLVAAALLRFWALSQGIGFNPGVDEPEVMERAVRMIKTGDFNPHFFDYPGLYIYVETAVSAVRFLAGAIQGQWTGLAGAPTDDFYLWGRAMTALLGTATVWLVYRAAWRWGRDTALFAAVLMAVMPLHVRESHYTLTDVPCTFAVALTFLLALRARERATVGSFALAGAAAGLAAAIKYNGILALVIPLVICAMTPALRKPRPLVALAVVATTVGTFLVAAPYTLLDLPHFLNEFARLSSEYRKAPTIAEPIWVIYLKHLRIALGTPGSVVVVAGLALGVWKSIAGPDRARWLAVWLFPLVYFRFVSNQTIVFARYLLPLVPFLAILGAAAVVAAVALLRRAAAPRVLQYAIVLALVAVSVGPPASAAIAYDANAAKTWTSALAYDWIRHNLPAGTAIRLEGSLAIKLPPIYKVSYVPTLRQNADDFAGAEYLVASSQSYGAFVDNPTGHPEENAAYQRIFAATEEVARFTPTDAHPGPELRILKVPQS